MDEMDLARQALDVTPWRPEEYERARAVLRGAMARVRVGGAGPAGLGGKRILAGAAAVAAGAGRPGQGRHRRRDRRGRGRGGGGARVHVGAAARPTPARRGVGRRLPGPAAPTSKLATLAALIQASGGPLTGNASLVIAKQVNGGKLMQVVYALFTDGGRLYLGDDKKTLMTEVVDHENQADGTNAREIAAARYAATGNLAAAVEADGQRPSQRLLRQPRRAEGDLG